LYTEVVHNCSSAMAHLSTPDLLNGRVVCIQLKCLSTELYGCLRRQQHQGYIEQEAAHEGSPNLHGVHSEHHQIEPHFCCALDHACYSTHKTLFVL